VIPVRGCGVGVVGSCRTGLTAGRLSHLMANIQNFLQNNQRVFKKTLSYYIMHITVAMLVAYVVTGNFWMAVTLSLLEPTVQAFAFFFHEKVWNKRDQKIAQRTEVKV
jgi:uncharacterized membrane protein